MGKRPARRFWSRVRRVVRWCRITVWLLLLALVSTAVYLSTVGLPGFLRTRVLAALHDRGVHLNCEQLHWKWYRGIVAHDVTFGPPDEAAGPRGWAAEVAVHGNVRALLHGRLEPRSLSIRDGRFRLRLSATNEPPMFFELTEIQCGLRFLPDNEWQIDQLQARCGDALVRVSGSIQNASDFNNRLAPASAATNTPAAAGPTLAEQLRAFTGEFDRIHFIGPPEVTLVIQGNARNWQEVGGLLTVRSPGAETRWGNFTNVLLTARLRPARHIRTLPFGKLTLEAEGARTPWATTERLRLSLNSLPEDHAETGIRGRLSVSAGRTTTQWGRASAVQCASTFTYTLTNPIPLEAAGEITFTRPRTPWGQAARVRLAGQFRQVTPAIEPDDSWAAWSKLAPFAFSWQMEASGVAAQNLSAERLACDGAWSAPQLLITNLEARLYGGSAIAESRLDVASRAMRLRWNSDFDLLGLQPALPEEALEWLQRISWTKPPALSLDASARLPAWTNWGPSFAAEVLPTLAGEGRFAIGPAAYQGVSVQSATGRVVYADALLRQLDLSVTRTEGALDVAETLDPATDELCWKVRSSIDPMIAQPFVGEAAQPAFSMVAFTTPPTVDAVLRLARTNGAFRSVAGTLAVSNVTFRGESAVAIRTGFSFTNQLLELYRPEAWFTNGLARTDGLQVDLATQRIYITNGFSTMDPLVLGRAIGDKTVLDIMHDYQFLSPPTARVWGTVALGGSLDFDLHLDLAGGPFRWWRIQSQQLRGNVSFVNGIVTLQDVAGEFYGGKLDFNARFDVAPTNLVTGLPTTNGAFMQFHAVATNANLQTLIQDLTGGARHLEGLFSADLTLTNAYTLDWNSWQAFGTLSLTDGQLWQVPVFSVFSTILNTLSPGLGNVHFKSAFASYGITNGVISSRDLEFNSALLRMNYRGSVDFHENMDGIVQASVLRNAGVLGSVFSTVLWPFTKALEYKVTGTLDKPQAEPLHAGTKLLLLPLVPLEAVTGIFTGSQSNTNVPAAK